MNEHGKYVVINPDGEIVTHTNTIRKAEKIIKQLSNAFNGEYEWRFAA